VDALEGRALLSTLVVQNLDDSGPHSLRAELAAAHDGDTIRFASGLGGTLTLKGGLLEVAASVSIRGPGAGVVEISGGGASQVFQVDPGVTASIFGLTIAEGLAPDGGAGGGILDQGTLTVRNCAFDNNAAPDGLGGAIEGDGPLTVSGCTFTNNSAQFGGGINATSTLSVSASNFVGNTGTTIGGAIGYGPLVPPAGPATVSGCMIENNTSFDGGGIGALGPIIIRNSVISGNTSPDPANGVGGGIWSSGSTMTVNNTLVIGNRSTLGGGIAGGGDWTITHSVIADNTASTTDPNGFAFGGGITFSGGFTGLHLTVTDSTISGNQVEGHTAGGGGIHADFGAVVSVSNSTFSDNTATSDFAPEGGAIDLSTVNQASLTNSSFVGNRAVLVSTSTFQFASANGGAVFLNGPGTVKGCSFIDNQAVNESNGGFGVAGALEITGFGNTLDLSDSTFTGNAAIGGPSGSTTSGGLGAGGAFVNFLGTSANITRTTFIGNRAVGGPASGAGSQGGLGFGGAIQNEAGTLTITNSRFLANEATGGDGSDGATGGDGWGGAIQSEDGSTLNLSSSLLAGNLARGGSGGGNGLGGGVYNASGGATITGTLITLNFAIGGDGGQGIGGGLYIDPTSGTVTLAGTTKVVGNLASTSHDNIFGPYQS
jgi:hypothetical protein